MRRCGIETQDKFNFQRPRDIFHALLQLTPLQPQPSFRRGKGMRAAMTDILVVLGDRRMGR
ncbi:hypothetical protein C5F44_07820 [Fuscovulum blasticum DSM 2131]|uniref:Uncharacterized protein n=1 Tax=Fuscovulum blasticum DSM 2131 TaxID=1188250 RepID=A0A2T4JA58_FUSBL|nr:hypothetical protein C5F44_07820 [Fuscovulum blasticum DSM 2131]